MSLRANQPPNHVLPPLSPISPSESPEWSPLNTYNYASNGTNSPAPNQHAVGPKGPIPNPVDTPPLSVHSSANSSSAPDGPLHLRQNGNPSPPSSLGRASIVTTATVDDRKHFEMEQTLAGHYRALLRFLGNRLPALRADPRQDRAKDKLQRLSKSQFQELSTDVFDELTRREDERRRGGPNNPGNPIPKYLLPRQNFHFKRNQARQKLSTLPTDRFTQLTTDVFFELERRFPRFARDGGRDLPDRNTPSRNGGAYPPRSVSRQDPDIRSRSREGFRNGPPPPFGAPGVQPGEFERTTYGKPLPKIYQSNVILPKKGTMVEDDDEDSLRSPSNGTSDSAVGAYKSQVEALERKVDELVIDLKEKDNEIVIARTTPREDLERERENAKKDLERERSRFEILREDLERKVKNAQNLNDSIQAELAKVRSEKDDVERGRGLDADLQFELEEARRRNEELERDMNTQLDAARKIARDNEEDLRRQLTEARTQAFNAPARSFNEDAQLRQRNEELVRELADQRKLTDEVRDEAAQFLEEMRSLSQRSTESVEKEEKLLDQIVFLEREIRIWKSRYAKTKSQARSLRSSSLGLPTPNSTASEYTRDAAFLALDGIIRDFHVMNFQVAIDDLLVQARSNDPPALTDSMKQVINTVQSITSDMDAVEGSPAMSNRQSKLRVRLSQAANNLITATKSHSDSAGIAPVSLVDAAASHLTAAVVDTVRTLKIKQSSAEELEREDMTEETFANARPAPLVMRSKGSVSSSITSGMMRNASTSSAGYSAYSRYSSRFSINTSPSGTNDIGYGGGPMGMLRENGVVEFRNYLEDTSAVLVRSIQPLVNTIRTKPSITTSDPILSAYIDDISATVYEMVAKSNTAVSDLSNAALRRHAPPVVSALEATAIELTERRNNGDVQGLPQLAFKIARATKELVLRLERIENGEITEKSNLTLDI